jgi:hypothetical protein
MGSHGELPYRLATGNSDSHIHNILIYKWCKSPYSIRQFFIDKNTLAGSAKAPEQCNSNQEERKNGRAKSN